MSDGSDATREEAPDPRFSLANERTLLAWNRTALALLAAGLAASELLRSDPAGLQRLFGVPLIVVGGLVAWGGFRRWRTVEGAIARGEPLPDSALPGLLTATVVVAAVVAAVVALK